MSPWGQRVYSGGLCCDLESASEWGERKGEEQIIGVSWKGREGEKTLKETATGTDKRESDRRRKSPVVTQYLQWHIYLIWTQRNRKALTIQMNPVSVVRGEQLTQGNQFTEVDMPVVPNGLLLSKGMCSSQSSSMLNLTETLSWQGTGNKDVGQVQVQ